MMSDQSNQSTGTMWAHSAHTQYPCSPAIARIGPCTDKLTGEEPHDTECFGFFQHRSAGKSKVLQLTFETASNVVGIASDRLENPLEFSSCAEKSTRKVSSCDLQTVRYEGTREPMTRYLLEYLTEPVNKGDVCDNTSANFAGTETLRVLVQARRYNANT